MSGEVYFLSMLTATAHYKCVSLYFLTDKCLTWYEIQLCSFYLCWTSKKKKAIFIQYTSAVVITWIGASIALNQVTFWACHLFELYVVALKVLGVSKEPGGVSDELHEVHHLPHLPPLPLHRGVCTAWHAALRWQVTHWWPAEAMWKSCSRSSIGPEERIGNRVCFDFPLSHIGSKAQSWCHLYIL